MPTAGAEDTEGGMIKFERHRAVGSLSKERVEAVPDKPSQLSSLKTLVSVMAYHITLSVEKWRLRTPPRYAALPPHAVTNFRA
jgi:hypothetical protein